MASIGAGPSPSPFVPSLLVGVFGLVILGPRISLVVLLLLALLIVQVLSIFSPIFSVSSDSFGNDAEGLGFGIFLLLVIYLVLFSTLA